MPAGNQKGPRGQGPMTGRAAGYCAGYPVPGYANQLPGCGFGWGRGRGFGRGRQFRGGNVPLGYPFAVPQVTREQEIEILKQQSEHFKTAFEEISGRIEELESARKE